MYALLTVREKIWKCTIELVIPTQDHEQKTIEAITIYGSIKEELQFLSWINSAGGFQSAGHKIPTQSYHSQSVVYPPGQSVSTMKNPFRSWVSNMCDKRSVRNDFFRFRTGLWHLEYYFAVFEVYTDPGEESGFPVFERNWRFVFKGGVQSVEQRKYRLRSWVCLKWV